ncbi:hypothetical protein ANN_01311, partial [Periplaneta americana]
MPGTTAQQIVEFLKPKYLVAVFEKLQSRHLRDRKHSVYFNGRCSNLISVQYGIPQGSVFGTLLFLIMINDLPFNIDIESDLFADDITLYATDRNVNELKVTITQSFDKAASWFLANGLNDNKTQIKYSSLRREVLTPSLTHFEHLMVHPLHKSTLMYYCIITGSHVSDRTLLITTPTEKQGVIRPLQNRAKPFQIINNQELDKPTRYEIFMGGAPESESNWMQLCVSTR